MYMALDPSKGAKVNISTIRKLDKQKRLQRDK